MAKVKASAENSWGSIAIVLALAALAFADTVRYGFVWDDPISVQRWLPALPTLSAAFFPPDNIPQFPEDYYRPLQLLTYRFDRAVGSGAPWAFHLHVVLLHIVASVLVLLTAKRLSGERLGRGATFAAALFAVHPIHSESVAWMAARPDVMVTCAGLGALLAWWQLGWSEWKRAGVAAALLGLALLSKENALALLLLIPLSTLFLGPPQPGTKRTTRPIFSIALIVPLVLAALGYGILRSLGTDSPSLSLVFPANTPAALLGAIGVYARLLLIPFPQNAYIADPPTSMGDLAVAAAALGLASAIAWRAWQKQDRAVLFCLLWISLTLAPSLAVLFKPPTAPLAERYLYLPSVGLCWLAGIAFTRLSASNAPSRWLSAGAMVVVLVGLGLTWQRNQIWRDNESLWQATAARNDIDALPMRGWAAAVLERGDVERAQSLFERALTMRNTDHGRRIIFNNLGTIALNRGDDAVAEANYLKAMELEPSADCLYNLGLISLRRGVDRERFPAAETRTVHLHKARELFEKALTWSPHDPEVHVAVAQVAQHLGDLTTARRHFDQALALGMSPAMTAAVTKLIASLGESVEARSLQRR